MERHGKMGSGAHQLYSSSVTSALGVVALRLAPTVDATAGTTAVVLTVITVTTPFSVVLLIALRDDVLFVCLRKSRIERLGL